MRKFEQRHYVEVARILSLTKPPEEELLEPNGRLWRTTVDLFVSAFEADSSKFNERKFYFAVGLLDPQL